MIGSTVLVPGPALVTGWRRRGRCHRAGQEIHRGRRGSYPGQEPIWPGLPSDRSLSLTRWGTEIVASRAGVQAMARGTAGAAGSFVAGVAPR